MLGILAFSEYKNCISPHTFCCSDYRTGEKNVNFSCCLFFSVILCTHFCACVCFYESIHLFISLFKHLVNLSRSHFCSVWKIGWMLLGMSCSGRTPFPGWLESLASEVQPCPCLSYINSYAKWECLASLFIVVYVNRCVNWNAFWKTLEKIENLCIRTQGSQRTDSIWDGEIFLT